MSISCFFRRLTGFFSKIPGKIASSVANNHFQILGKTTNFSNGKLASIGESDFVLFAENEKNLKVRCRTIVPESLNNNKIFFIEN